MARLTAGGAIFARLKALGVERVFTNSGTDFPPIIEGLAQAEQAGLDLPEVLTIPHENVAMGMAHGAWLATGGLQAVMLHTNTGLANGVIGALNAARDEVPVIIMSGRTPTTEAGRFGARTVPIGWGQEMFDQHALIREACKWDYELRFPEQVSGVLDRAAALALSWPRRPVYLSLPREVIAEEIEIDDAPPSMRPARLAPDPGTVAQAAALLAGAERPLILVQRGAGTAEGYAALDRLAADWAIPVSDWWPLANPLRHDHPTYVGPGIARPLAEADVVLSIDCMAPWGPSLHETRPKLRVIHLAPDPLMSRIPVRTFRADLTLATETGPGLVALEAAMAGRPKGRADARRAAVEAMAAEAQAAIRAAGAAQPGQPLSKAHVGACIGAAVRGRDAIVLSELGIPPEQLAPDGPGRMRQEPHAGGLGWSFPAALGLKLTAPEKLVIATCGDGSYMFANPVACHQVAEAYGIAPLIVILNNAEYAIVRHSTRAMYPDGAAARSNRDLLTDLSPSPDFCAVARASRAWAERVETAEDLPGALERAIAATEAGRQALLEIIVAG